jgi:hypothetical protein
VVAIPPLPEVIAAIEADTTRITRRVEIYESDGATLWQGAGAEPRLVDGSVTVDFTRDERRAVEVTLDNTDGLLKHDPNNGLWYDKIVKAYRGITYDVSKKQPKILIVQDTLVRLRADLRNLGFTNVFTNLAPTGVIDFDGYDIIAADAHQGAVSPGILTLLNAAYAAGYEIWTCGNDNDETTIPFITASVTKATDANWSLNQPGYDTVLASAWNSVTNSSNDAGRLPTAFALSAVGVATMLYNGVLGYTAVINVNGDNTRWFHLQIAEREANVRQLIKNSINWLYGTASTKEYETPVGVFMIDNINEEYFPRQVKITGRDYTKKLLLSKIGNALTFTSGTSIGTIVKNVAANAGIFQTRIDTSNALLTADVSFEKSVSRWEIIHTICEAYQYEVFFDSSGHLVVQPFLDPLTSPTSLTLAAGSNLITYSKSSNDTRIFNHVTVISDNQDQIAAGILIFAEAKNNEPSSPTRIDRLGDRVNDITSSVVANVAQAQALANSMLKIAALESYDLSWGTLVYPWIEAGQILEFEDPRIGVDEPDRFLMDAFTVPMGLEQMTGTAKRVTIVGTGSSPGDPLFSLTNVDSQQ